MAVKFEHLKTPNLLKELWNMIFGYLSLDTILKIEKVSVLFAKLASVQYKNHGEKILKKYGSVFATILKENKMSYYNFFKMCERGKFTEGTLPFYTLFNLPPGFAKEYIPYASWDMLPDVYMKGTYRHIKRTRGVILCANGKYAGNIQLERCQSWRFFIHKTYTSQGTLRSNL